MNINAISRVNNSRMGYKSLKNNPEYVKRKREYLDVKTKKLDEISLGTLILGTGTRIIGNTDVMASKNLSGVSSKVSNGFIGLSLITFLGTVSKKIQSSKEFDQMNQEK